MYTYLFVVNIVNYTHLLISVMENIINFTLIFDATSTLPCILYTHKTINILIKLSKHKEIWKKSTKTTFKKQIFWIS